jgi:hypothetical protein
VFGHDARGFLRQRAAQIVRAARIPFAHFSRSPAGLRRTCREQY